MKRPRHCTVMTLKIGFSKLLTLRRQSLLASWYEMILAINILYLQHVESQYLTGNLWSHDFLNKFYASRICNQVCLFVVNCLFNEWTKSSLIGMC